MYGECSMHNICLHVMFIPDIYEALMTVVFAK